MKNKLANKVKQMEKEKEKQNPANIKQNDKSKKNFKNKITDKINLNISKDKVQLSKNDQINKKKKKKQEDEEAERALKKKQEEEQEELSRNELNEYKKSLVAEVNSNPQPTCIVRTDSIIEICNTSFASMFNYYVDELIGANVNLLVDKNLKNYHDNYVQQFFKNDNGFTIVRKLKGMTKENKLKRFEFTLILRSVVQKNFKFRYCMLYAKALEDLTEYDDIFIINSKNYFSKIYDAFYVIFNILLMFYIPYAIVFERILLLTYIAKFILTSQIYIGFNRTYYNYDDEFIIDRYSIMTHYLRTWFLYDIVMVAVWFFESPKYILAPLKICTIIKGMKQINEYFHDFDYIMYKGPRWEVYKTKQFVENYTKTFGFIMLIIIQFLAIHWVSIIFYEIEHFFVDSEHNWMNNASHNYFVTSTSMLNYLHYFNAVIHNLLLFHSIEYFNQVELTVSQILYVFGFYLFCINFGWILYQTNEKNVYEQVQIDEIEETLKFLYKENMSTSTLNEVEKQLNESYRNIKVKSIIPLANQLDNSIYIKLKSEYYASLINNFKLFSMINMDYLEIILKSIVSRNRPKVFQVNNDFEFVYMVIKGKIICYDNLGAELDDFVDNEIVYPKLLEQYLFNTDQEVIKDDNASSVTGGNFKRSQSSMSKASSFTKSNKYSKSSRTGKNSKKLKSIKYEANGIANENTDYYVLSKEVFKNLIIKSPDIYNVLWMYLKKKYNTISYNERKYSKMCYSDFESNKRAGLIVFNDFELFQENPSFSFCISPLKSLYNDEGNGLYLHHILFNNDGSKLADMASVQNGVYLFRNNGREMRVKIVKEKKNIVLEKERLSNGKKVMVESLSSIFFIYLSSENDQPIRMTRAEVVLNILKFNHFKPRNVDFGIECKAKIGLSTASRSFVVKQEKEVEEE